MEKSRQGRGYSAGLLISPKAPVKFVRGKALAKPATCRASPEHPTGRAHADDFFYPHVVLEERVNE